MKSRGIPQPVLIALIAAGFLLAAVGGYFLLIQPQHAKAADLDARSRTPTARSTLPER